MFGGSAAGPAGGALGLFQGFDGGQPCGGWEGCWPGFALLTLEVFAGDWSGKASANEKSSVPDILLREKRSTVQAGAEPGSRRRPAAPPQRSGVGRGKRAAPLLQNITWVRLVQQALLMRSIILLQKKGGPPAPAALHGEHSTGGGYQVQGQWRRWERG